MFPLRESALRAWWECRPFGAPCGFHLQRKRPADRRERNGVRWCAGIRSGHWRDERLPKSLATGSTRPRKGWMGRPACSRGPRSFRANSRSARRGRARLASCGTRNDSQRDAPGPPSESLRTSKPLYLVLWIGFISISSLDGNVRRIEWVQYTRDAEPPASKRVCESTANRQNAVGFPGANPPYALKIPTKQADSGRGFFHAPPPCNFQC